MNRRGLDILQHEGFLISLVFIWGLFVFYTHLSDLSLLGDEAMYAAIGRRIARTREWYPLIYMDEPYLNKPPLHFWLMAGSFLLWGESEFAVRFFSATFGLATTFLSYFAGRMLYQWRVGLVAALITTTTFASVWVARKGNMNVELGFWMNLAFFTFCLAYRGGSRRIGYLCVAFFSMTVAVMLKGPIGLLLPGIGALTYLGITRRKRFGSEVPFLALGLAILSLITGCYYSLLGGAFNRHFLFVENFSRLRQQSEPVLYYFYMIFPYFFPWSLLLPAVGAQLWFFRARPTTDSDLLIRLWALTFFLALNVPSYKQENFLVYLTPSFALLVARYWDHLLGHSEAPLPTEDRLLRISAIVLAVVAVSGVFVKEVILSMRLPRFPEFMPALPMLVFLLACGVMAYVAYEGYRRAIFSSVLASAMMMTFGLVQFFYPAIGQYVTLRTISQEVRSIVGDSPVVLVFTAGNSGLAYYLAQLGPVTNVESAEALRPILRANRQVFALMGKDRYDELDCDGEISLLPLAYYSFRKWRYVLVTNRPPG